MFKILFKRRKKVISHYLANKCVTPNCPNFKMGQHKWCKPCSAKVMERTKETLRLYLLEKDKNQEQNGNN